MKKALIILTSAVFLLTAVFAFGQNDNNGKTYYDKEQTKPKEIFMLKEVVMFDPNNPSASEKTKQKHGPYFYYYENGKLKISGEYKNDEKHGTWKYYDDKGKLTSQEKFENGQPVK